MPRYLVETRATVIRHRYVRAANEKAAEADSISARIVHEEDQYEETNRDQGSRRSGKAAMTALSPDDIRDASMVIYHRWRAFLPHEEARTKALMFAIRCRRLSYAPPCLPEVAAVLAPDAGHRPASSFAISPPLFPSAPVPLVQP